MEITNQVQTRLAAGRVTSNAFCWIDWERESKLFINRFQSFACLITSPFKLSFLGICPTENINTMVGIN